MKRIGIYAGTFDPLHAGHISFALAAVGEANLNQVYFLPERFPRHKPTASPYEQRVTGIRETIVSQSQLDLIEFPERTLSVHETLPELRQRFPAASIIFLIGSDVVTHMHTWPEIDQLVSLCEFAVGMRTGSDEAAIMQELHALHIPDTRYAFVHTDKAHVSSTAIRSTTN